VIHEVKLLQIGHCKMQIANWRRKQFDINTETRRTRRKKSE
jgi:hypothetical protein